MIRGNLLHLFSATLLTSTLLTAAATTLLSAPTVYKCPQLSGKSIIFAEHKQYPQDHHNTANIFQFGEINQHSWNGCKGDSALYKVDFDASGNPSKPEVLAASKEGLIRDPEVSWDAKKIIFSMRKNANDSYNIYEYDLSNNNTSQLTKVAEACDIDPIYLGDGSILFTSTRAAKYCGCNRHIMCNLYKMDADGSNIVQIGNSIEFENMPTVMRDGRILYTRWEYVDRNFSGAQGLWTCNPDGTAHTLYWGQETKQPCINSVQMPESTTIAAILTSCHDIAWGALVIIDRKIDVEGEHSVIKIFPQSARELINKKGDKWADSMKSVKLKYEDPEPIDAQNIIVSRMMKENERKMGLYILNIETGKETLLADSDKDLSLLDAKILAPRILPQTSADRRQWRDDSKSLVYVGNVYVGTHMQGVKRGEIKWLRVIQDHFKLTYSHGWWENEGSQAPAMNFDDYDRKQLLGIVPVAEDGSAFFEAPADKFIYLQALDANGDMVQTMRSGFVLLPGEIASCVGCHESRFSPPPLSGKPFKNGKPDKINTYPKSATGECFSYMKMVQPIFDKHCIQCHGNGGTAADKLNLSADRGLVFNKSYLELHRKKAVKAIGAGPDKIPQANAWGAKQSSIVKLLRGGHNDVKLSDEEFAILRLWIDLNAPYYATEDCTYPENPTGRSPLTTDEIIKVFELCNVKPPVQKGSPRIHANNYKYELISFDHPETSDILKSAKTEADKKTALQIIKLGAQRLKEKPRADMQGFVQSKIATQRIKRFKKFVEAEKRVRRAKSDDVKIGDVKTIEEIR